MADKQGKLAKRIHSMFSFADWTPPLIILIMLLVLIFFTGGTSRYDTPHIIFLRPIAIMVAGYAITTISAENWRQYRPLWLLAMAICCLLLIHLIPLPPFVWQALPGREIVVEIDAAMGFDDMWRPLTLSEEGTANALFSLTVPLAVLLLATQLGEKDQFRILIVVMSLCILSGLLGVAQAAGTEIRLYRISSENSGLFANRNHQAAMLAALFPMLAAVALSAPYYTPKARIVRFLAMIAIVALVPLILVTGSRMGLVVGAIAFGCLVFMRFRRSAGGGVFTFRPSLQIMMGFILAASMVLATIYAGRDEAIDRMAGSENGLRWPLWQSVLETIPDYWPWGSGVGSFVPVYQVHEKAEMLLPTYINQAHNDWLDIPLTSGLPGLLIALGALVFFIFGIKPALKYRGVAGHLRRCGLIVIVVLAFASLSDYPLRTPILSSLLVISAVWALSPGSKREKEG